jgi:hypothetical protein
MPKPMSRISNAWAQGYEPNSIAARMTGTERKAFREWLNARANDNRVLESQLKGKKDPRRSPYVEV